MSQIFILSTFNTRCRNGNEEIPAVRVVQVSHSHEQLQQIMLQEAKKEIFQWLDECRVLKDLQCFVNQTSVDENSEYQPDWSLTPNQMAEYYAKCLSSLSIVQIYHAHHSAQIEDLTVWKVEDDKITWSRGHRHISAIYIASRWEIHQMAMPKETSQSSNLFSSWVEKPSMQFGTILSEHSSSYKDWSRGLTEPSRIDICASSDSSLDSSRSSGSVSIDGTPQWYVPAAEGDLSMRLPEQALVSQRKRLRSTC
jgi:hypothetical protein